MCSSPSQLIKALIKIWNKTPDSNNIICLNMLKTLETYLSIGPETFAHFIIQFDYIL